jgi:glycosyltransferase involved in cell wall biosynthesis
MRILVNAAGANIGGGITYLGGVLSRLPELIGEHEVWVAAPEETLDRFPRVLEHPHVHALAYREPPLRLSKRVRYDQVEVRRLIRRLGIDLLYSINGFGTFRCPCPQALLISNVMYFCDAFEARYRELGRSLRTLRLKRLWGLLSIRSSDLVVFPTEAARQDVGSHIDLGKRRTRVIHYGFDRDAFFDGATERSDFSKRMESWRREGARVLLSASSFAVQKNFETLVEALPQLVSAAGRVKLVLTISREKTADLAEYDALTRRIAELGLDEVVEISGFVPFGQLQHLYRQTDVYVFPSVTESFGLSMLEAMACGLPVVAADRAVNREVLGDAALYFATFDPADCGRALLRVLGDDSLREQLGREGSRRVESFAWSAHTRTLIEEFARLVSGRPGDQRGADAETGETSGR